MNDLYGVYNQKKNDQDELMHYGVKGMKWGVRRYQNYDGSYTRAGVKRFNDSLSKYEKANDRYKTAKAQYKKSKKSGSSTSSMKTELTNARLAKKQAKQKLDKDYKHLKQDKLGDQGKELYSKGNTIRSNNKTTSFLTKVGAMSAATAAYNYQTGKLGDEKVTKWLAGIGAGTIAVAGIKQGVDYSQNKKLRAYYSHTSNY